MCIEDFIIIVKEMESNLVYSYDKEELRNLLYTLEDITTTVQRKLRDI